MKKEDLDLSVFTAAYPQFRDNNIQGRLLTHLHIKKSLEDLEEKFQVVKIGKSTLGNPIHSISFGDGDIKILAWSQMHGNETTTTKAIFDLFRAMTILEHDPVFKTIKERLTVRIIPILNPDGAIAYTRENFNKVDLNRDAFNLEETESRILRREFDSFAPDFCLNLHDQRTIFSAGDGPDPAVLSFLTPSMDEMRKITPSRKISMQIIASINRDLQEFLRGKIGRYDDSFNPNCTGDTFQSFEVPTILFEAGHFPGDYQREKTREFVTYAFISALNAMATGSYRNMNYEEYFYIPENNKLFHDVILRNAKVKGQIVDIAIQFKETPDQDQVLFIPFLEKVAPSLGYFGHKEIDCKEMEVSWEGSAISGENVIVNKIFMNNEIMIIN